MREIRISTGFQEPAEFVGRVIRLDRAIRGGDTLHLQVEVGGNRVDIRPMKIGEGWSDMIEPIAKVITLAFANAAFIEMPKFMFGITFCPQPKEDIRRGLTRMSAVGGHIWVYTTGLNILGQVDSLAHEIGHVIFSVQMGMLANQFPTWLNELAADMTAVSTAGFSSVALIPDGYTLAGLWEYWVRAKEEQMGGSWYCLLRNLAWHLDVDEFRERVRVLWEQTRTMRNSFLNELVMAENREDLLKRYRFSLAEAAYRIIGKWVESKID